jgi:thiol-disulfide isomerase/thioredoxin
MKKISLFLLFFFSVIHLNAQKKGFRLEGTITNADSLKEATIFTFGESTFKSNKVAIVNNKFVIEGEVEHPCLAIINTDKVRGGLGVWLTNDEIKVDFFVKKYEEDGYSLLQSQSVEGSQESKDYLFLINQMNEIRELEKNPLKQHLKICEETEKYILNHKDSYLSLSTLKSTIADCGTSKTRDLLSQLSKELVASSNGLALKDNLEKIEFNAIGKTITDFIMPNDKGQNVQISSVVKGMTVIAFWASWCGPCRAENRDFVKNKKLFDEKGVKIIGVSLDDDKEAWISAIAKDQADWLQLSDLKGQFDSKISKQFKITSIPYLLLIDKDMKIQAVGSYSNIAAKINLF